jgi:hypothetical protein
VSHVTSPVLSSPHATSSQRPIVPRAVKAARVESCGLDSPILLQNSDLAQARNFACPLSPIAHLRRTARPNLHLRPSKFFSSESTPMSTALGGVLRCSVAEIDARYQVSCARVRDRSPKGRDAPSLYAARLGREATLPGAARSVAQGARRAPARDALHTKKSLTNRTLSDLGKTPNSVST